MPNARSPSANPSEPKDNGAQSSDYEMDYASSRGEDSETARATVSFWVKHGTPNMKVKNNGEHNPGTTKQQKKKYKILP